MKRIVTFSLFILFTWCAFAQRTSLIIGSQSVNQRFWVFVDDVLQNQYSVSSVRIDGLKFQQPYRVRIEMDNISQNVTGQNIVLSQKYRTNSFLVLFRNGDYFIRRANFTINPMVALSLIVPNYNYYNDYNSYLYPGFGNYGNYWGKSGKKYSSTELPNDYSGNNGHNYGNDNRNGNNNWDNNHYNNGNRDNQNTGNYGGNNRGNNYNNQGNTNNDNNQYYNGNNPCMPGSEFNTALNSISNDNNDAAKLNKAQQIINRNSMCTSQIIQVIKQFSFETNKLEFAKYAYQHCTDKNNYYLVTDALTYQTSKDELLKYIR